MTTKKIYIKGELFLSLEVVADIYQVRAGWLREIYDTGLLGEGTLSAANVCIPAVQMDRVASIVRLHSVLGLDLEMIALTLEDEDY